MLGRKCLSNASLAPALTALTPGKSGCGSVAAACVIGATRPSKPPAVGRMRKALAGVDTPAQGLTEVVLIGLKHCTAWIRPVLRSGVSQSATPFNSPYRMLYPPRITVLFRP